MKIKFLKLNNLFSKIEITIFQIIFQEAVVFVVGGGNYIEYQNLMELAQSKGGGGISSPSASSVSLLSPGNIFPQFLPNVD